MKILIAGCNNHKCEFHQDGKCDLPAYGMNMHGHFDTQHEFDYDHITGKLSCRNCLTGDG